jgi:hypothetical protein
MKTVRQRSPQAGGVGLIVADPLTHWAAMLEISNDDLMTFSENFHETERVAHSLKSL